jgi:N-acetylglutamate synthase-like GNAT family acetyltransferase
VDELVVSGAMRRKGIATELLERAFNRARMLGCKRVEIVAPDASAQAYLEHRGFTSTGGGVMGWRNADAK